MKEIHMLLGYAPVYGRDLSHELIKNEEITLCYNAAEQLCSSIYDCEREENQIVHFNWRTGKDCVYEKICDINQLPALCKDLMQQMLPYESMAIKLGMRTTNVPIVDYESEKRNYHKHLRFWNYVFEKYKINRVFFEEFPHIPYTYVIYALALVKKIPLLMCSLTTIRGIRVYGNSIENAGINIQKYYETFGKDMDMEDCILDGAVREYFTKYSREITDIKEERRSTNFEKLALKKQSSYLYGRHQGIKRYIKVIKQSSVAVYKNKDWNWVIERIKGLAEYRKQCQQVRYFMHHKALTQKEYNKIAEIPDYSKKYIYFGLQVTPEETTMPRAGVFSEQYTSIQLLAKAAEREKVYVYVKEHFVQSFRDKEFYHVLKQIPNVKLIKTSVSSFDLMSHSIAAATQTGSCILEGVLMGKPILVTGEGYSWKGLPGLFEIIDEKQGQDIIRNILSDYTVNRDEVKKYLYSIQKNSIPCFMQSDWINQKDKPEHKETVKNIIEVINDFI